jgi:hypothetical protein
MKILRPIGGTAGIFFPIGELNKNGTCENATKECLKFCCAKWGIDHNEEYRISDQDKHKIYSEFINKPIFELCVKILKEMKELRVDILHWFASGDCMDKDIERLTKIMSLLNHNTSIYQNGFTKNGNIFSEVDDLERVCIVHTVQSKSDINETNTDRIFAVCNYDHGDTRLYTSDRIYSGSCGASEYKLRSLSFVNDCRTCLRLKKGCFTNIKL